MTIVVEIRLLGRFSIRRGGEEIPPSAFGGRLVRVLVRLLVTRAGEFVARDALTEALWPRRPPADPAMNIKVLVKRARDALGDPSLIVTGSGGYSFAADDRCELDAETFLQRVRAGREQMAGGSASVALREFRSALEGWGGDPLAEDAYDDWAQEYRSMLFRAHLEALEGAAHAALAMRDPRQAVSFAELAVAREPLREASHLLLMESLAASGDSAAALATFDAFRRRLADELGLDPSSDANDIQARILRGERLPPTPRKTAEPARRAPFDTLPFVGREHEVESVLSLVSGAGPVRVVVSGPMGVGKTRLLGEVAARSTVPVLAAKAFLPDREEAWGLARSLLREALALDLEAARRIPERAAQALAAILPELEELRPTRGEPLDPESRRALAMEGGIRLIEAAAGKGALLLADNLHWADATSLAFLDQLARRVRGVALLLAYRTEEVSPDVPLPSFLADLSASAAVVRIPLEPLSERVVSELVSEEALTQVIVRETDRTPLAIAEVIRDLAQQGAIEPDLRGGWRTRTDGAIELARELARVGQHRAIRSRAERQSLRRRQILHLLSLLGREAAARLLADAAREEQSAVLDDLDALARAGLVRLGDDGWAMAHDLMGEAIVDGLGRPERARLHHMLVRVLTGEGADPSELARHLEGTGDREGAAKAFAEAAEQRLGRYAAEEAERLADAGLALSPKASVRSQLLETRAEACSQRGDFSGARDDLRAILEDMRAGPDRSRLLGRLAMLISGSEDYVRANELIELALAEAGADSAARAGALWVGSIMDMNTARWDRARLRADEALALFERVGDADGVASIMDLRATTTFLQGMVRQSVDMLDSVAHLFRDSGKLLRVVNPRSNHAWALVLTGRADEGLSSIDEALALSRTLGYPEGEALCLWIRGEALAASGRVSEAKETAEAAVNLARQIGHREFTAMSLTGLGMACEAQGDLEGAEAALRQSLEVAGNMLMAAAGCQRLSSVLVAKGDFDSAQAYADRALAQDLPVAHLEARLVKAEIAAARGDAQAHALADEALALAEAAGWVASSGYARLKKLFRGKPGREGMAAGRRRERKTFMFTDIVRSTNLVEALGDDEAWEQLLGWHDQTLRSLFRCYRGNEVKQVGDGFLVVFDAPQSAVECAVAIQRALKQHRLEHGFSPQVRVGLHEAEATRKGDDFQGSGVHQAARIGALAQAGEIIASRAVVRTCPFAVSEPRPVVLKGFSEPTTVVSIDWR